MGMGFAPTWLRQVSPLLHKTTLTTGQMVFGLLFYIEKNPSYDHNSETTGIAVGYR